MWPRPDAREDAREDGLEPPRRYVGSPEEVRERLGGLLPPQALGGSMLFVAAHPEDLVRGASWLLRRGPGAHVVHVTDEPASLEALWLAGLTSERLFSLGAVKPGAGQELVTLTECLLALLKALRPSLLVLPAQGGGDPDREATAFITHTAVALLLRGGRTPPSLLEMAGPCAAGVTVHLSEPERLLKQRMLACYPSRDRDPSPAEDESESYRLARPYDFTRPPREGPRVEGWSRRAREALETLKLADTSPH